MFLHLSDILFTEGEVVVSGGGGGGGGGGIPPLPGGRYASYWNAFLLLIFFDVLIVSHPVLSW